MRSIYFEESKSPVFKQMLEILQSKGELEPLSLREEVYLAKILTERALRLYENTILNDELREGLSVTMIDVIHNLLFKSIKLVADTTEKAAKVEAMSSSNTNDFENAKDVVIDVINNEVNPEIPDSYREKLISKVREIGHSSNNGQIKLAID